MDLKKVAEALTNAANELRGTDEKKNELNAALGMALTEIVAALRIVKAQAALPPESAEKTAAKK